MTIRFEIYNGERTVKIDGIDYLDLTKEQRKLLSSKMAERDDYFKMADEPYDIEEDLFRYASLFGDDVFVMSYASNYQTLRFKIFSEDFKLKYEITEKEHAYNKSLYESKHIKENEKKESCTQEEYKIINNKSNKRINFIRRIFQSDKAYTYNKQERKQLKK